MTFEGRVLIECWGRRPHCKSKCPHPAFLVLSSPSVGISLLAICTVDVGRKVHRRRARRMATTLMAFTLMNSPWSMSGPQLLLSMSFLSEILIHANHKGLNIMH